jgi:hypothetical protein
MPNEKVPQRTHERKREELVEQMKRNAGVVRTFIDSACAISEDDNPSEYFNTLWKKIFNSFPTESRHAYEAYKSARADRDRLSDEYEHVSGTRGVLSPEFDKQFKEAQRRVRAARSQDPKGHIALLSSLRTLSTNLEKKRVVIQQIGNDRADAIAALVRASNFQIPAEAVKQVDTSDPLSICFTVEKNAYVKAYGDTSLGCHLQHTPFCLVRSDFPDPTIVKRHERIHNIAEDLVTIAEPTRIFAASMTRIIKAHITGQETGFEWSLDPRMYLQYLHGEVVAAFGEVRPDGLTTRSEEALASWPQQSNATHDQRDLEYFSYKLCTAGSHFIEMLNAIDTYLGDSSMPESIRQRLQSFKTTLEKDFLRIARNLERAFEIANRGSTSEVYREQLHEELLILLAMLPPSRYQHLVTYAQAREKEAARENSGN